MLMVSKKQQLLTASVLEIGLTRPSDSNEAMLAFYRPLLHRCGLQQHTGVWQHCSSPVHSPISPWHSQHLQSRFDHIRSHYSFTEQITLQYEQEYCSQHINGQKLKPTTIPQCFEQFVVASDSTYLLFDQKDGKYYIIVYSTIYYQFRYYSTMTIVQQYYSIYNQDLITLDHITVIQIRSHYSMSRNTAANT